MAANSKHSAKTGKPSISETGNGEVKTLPSGAKPLPQPARRRGDMNISADEALQILQSAISYCQYAGLVVTYANGPEGMTLHLAGCVVHEEMPCFVLAKARG